MNMLHEKVSSEIVHRPELKSLQQTLDYVLLDLNRWADRKIAQVHEQHVAGTVNTGAKNPVMSIHTPLKI